MCFWISWNAWQQVRLNSSLQRQKLASSARTVSRVYQKSLTYYTYAKALRELSFRFGQVSSLYKREAVRRHHPKDFAKLKEDLQFLDSTLKTVLAPYQILSGSGLWRPIHPQIRGSASAEPRQCGLSAKETTHRAGAAAERAG